MWGKFFLSSSLDKVKPVVLQRRNIWSLLKSRHCTLYFLLSGRGSFPKSSKPSGLLQRGSLCGLMLKLQVSTEMPRSHWCRCFLWSFDRLAAFKNCLWVFFVVFHQAAVCPRISGNLVHRGWSPPGVLSWQRRESISVLSDGGSSVQKVVLCLNCGLRLYFQPSCMLRLLSVCPQGKLFVPRRGLGRGRIQRCCEHMLRTQVCKNYHKHYSWLRH